MMKATQLTLASALMVALCACTANRSPLVPDMKYTGPLPSAKAPTTVSPSGEPSTISDDQLLPPMTDTPAPTVPAPTTTPSYGSALIPTAPSAGESTITGAAPAVTPSPYPTPQPTVTTPTVPTTPSVPTPTVAAPEASSTIPVATKVEGDPHRVYNPWNPNQRIVITNPKTGQPFPSGKKLAIPGTTKYFLVQ